MIKEPKELKAGQIVIAPPDKEESFSWRDASYYNRTTNWRSGTVVKHISGVPNPGVYIKWDNGFGFIIEYDAEICWEKYHAVNNEQERLALMLKLS